MGCLIRQRVDHVPWDRAGSQEGVCLPLSSPHAEFAHQFETHLFEMNCMFASRGRGGATLNHTEGGEGEIDGGCLVLPNARRQLPHRRRGGERGSNRRGADRFLDALVPRQVREDQLAVQLPTKMSGVGDACGFTHMSMSCVSQPLAECTHRDTSIQKKVKCRASMCVAKTSESVD